MTWVAVAVGGAAVIGAGASMYGASKQAGAAQNAQGISQQEFNTITQQEQPYMGSGYGALSALDWGLGITPQTNQQATGRIGQPGGAAAAPNGQYIKGANGSMVPYRPADAPMRTPVGKAGGGMITGPGGPRSDSVPINASNGEFVVNASAVSQPGVLRYLHQLNGNYANGGLVQPVQPGAGDSLTPGRNIDPNYFQDHSTTGTGIPSGNSPGPGYQNIDGSLVNTSGNAGLGYGSLSKLFDTSDWQSLSPQYNFQKSQGLAGAINGDASGQGALSGSAVKDATAFNQGIASTSFGNAFNQYQTQQSNIFNRLYDIAGLGQTSAANTGQQGTALAGQQAQSAQNVGNAWAGGAAGVSNSLNSGAQVLPWINQGKT